MSLLGSLLGPGGSKPSTPSNPAAGPLRSRDTTTQILKRSPPPTDKANNTRDPAQRPIGTTTNGARPLQPPIKRKAEGDVDGARPKAQRGDSSSNVNSARHTSNLASTKNAGAYRGTAARSREKLPMRPVKTTGPSSTSNSIQRSQTQNPPSATRPTPAPSLATKPPTSTTQAVPKKGSYAEIMARASAANASAPTTGIKHKVKEPINLKKLKAEAQLAEKNKAIDQKKGAGQKGFDRGRGIQSNSGGAIKGPEKRRTPIELGYKGTARPAPPPPTAQAPPTYKGTMGMKRPDASRDRPGGPNGRNALASKSAASRRSRNEYYATDEDEDDGDEEAYGRDEEDKYYSDASSDMEANMFDVDREEQDALKAAKREDADEQAKLERLEREKRQRKQLALAKALNEKKERRRLM